LRGSEGNAQKSSKKTVRSFCYAVVNDRSIFDSTNHSMTSHPSRHTVTYIVRIWSEYLDESPPRWRGVVVPVGEETPLHFAGLGEMLEIIRQKTQPPIEKEDKP